MSKYVPDLIQRLYANKEYRGKTILLHNIKYDSEDRIVSYDIYDVYDSDVESDKQANKDWAKLADRYQSVEDIKRNVILKRIPFDLDEVDYL